VGDETDVPEFSADGPGLIYAAVADHLATRISRGDLQPGERLTPERELAAEYGVAYLTVRRAMQELRERGLIVTVHGKGTFVRAEP
jgi:DNA-binding GntR family transcriptional regulator